MGTYKRLPRGRKKTSNEFRTFAEKVYVLVHQKWKVVTAVCVLSIALVVAIIAGYKYKNWRATEAFNELAQADAVEKDSARLKELADVAEEFRGTSASRKALLMLGKAAVSDGRAEDALKWFEMLSESSGRHSMLKVYSLIMMGRAYEELERYKDAALVYDWASTMKDNLLKEQSTYDRARCLEKLGQLNQAEELYQEVVDNAGDEDALLKAKSEERLLWLLASGRTEVTETE